MVKDIHHFIHLNKNYANGVEINKKKLLINLIFRSPKVAKIQEEVGKVSSFSFAEYNLPGCKST